MSNWMLTKFSAKVIRIRIGKIDIVSIRTTLKSDPIKRETNIAIETKKRIRAVRGR